VDVYDLIVIGTGTAAQVASTRVRKTGRSVAVIDHDQSVRLGDPARPCGRRPQND
jgi:pyruvate/2-oxoglutarate dehydrogenase complex dihydrolipoamide dehydrogenase (E3) component